MFTGLVEKCARVNTIEQKSGFIVLTLELEDASSYAQQLGESIAVNGCCLTLTYADASLIRFDINHETLAKTNLGALQIGSHVNLERAMRLGDRLGGHLVSGHIDGQALLEKLEQKPGGWDVFVRLPRELGRYVIAKGSIALDGVSLTVNSLEDASSSCLIRLTLIPTTIDLTTFRFLKEGWSFNVEVDQLGKYIERLLHPHQA